jgi:hypothetical protein
MKTFILALFMGEIIQSKKLSRGGRYTQDKFDSLFDREKAPAQPPLAEEDSFLDSFVNFEM